ncbi:MAG: helix-turn-helix transcriptional regulator [Bacteroidales bacterium]|jgi:transcriptional regulator with XRE-family HTH domain|nr:helix-turn-helix transcriptional regulator [Bacteroidales bacterium]
MDESFIKNNINTYRKSKDLTQIEAAQALNISTNAYRKIEKGNTAIINSHVRELADLFEMSLEELFLGYSPSATLDTTINEVKAEYGSQVTRLENRIEYLEKLNESLEETIASKNEIITMLKKMLGEQK